VRYQFTGVKGIVQTNWRYSAGGDLCMLKTCLCWKKDAYEYNKHSTLLWTNHLLHGVAAYLFTIHRPSHVIEAYIAHSWYSFLHMRNICNDTISFWIRHKVHRHLIQLTETPRVPYEVADTIQILVTRLSRCAYQRITRCEKQYPSELWNATIHRIIYFACI
jgi:hypothetical protein